MGDVEESEVQAVAVEAPEQRDLRRTQASVQLLTALASLSLAELVLMPLLAALVMTVVYVSLAGWAWDGAAGAAAGLIVAFAGGALLAGVYQRAARSGGQLNPVEWSGLDVRRKRLHIELDAYDDRQVVAALLPEGADPGTKLMLDPRPAITARDEARMQLRELDEVLNQGGSGWLTGAAFLTGWRRLHRVEEAFVLCGPLSLVIPGAIHDEMRLVNSEIPASDRWLTKLRIAVADLSAAGARYLAQMPPIEHHDARHNRTPDPLEARATLRLVRNAINEYRDDSYQGLVRLRNRLVITLAICSLTAYLLLTVVVIHRTSVTVALSALLFFLFGAIVGGVYQLQLTSQADSQVEDFGLTTARVFAATILSGLAAVVGVTVTAILGLTVAGLSLGPQSVGLFHLPAWQDVFSWNHNPAGFVVAALFGLVPGRLVDLLQKEAGSLGEQIRSSEASGSARSDG